VVVKEKVSRKKKQATVPEGDYHPYISPFGVTEENAEAWYWQVYRETISRLSGQLQDALRYASTNISYARQAQRLQTEILNLRDLFEGD
jgi:hypothetical protein